MNETFILIGMGLILGQSIWITTILYDIRKKMDEAGTRLSR